MALAAGALPASCARKVVRARKTLRIIQWSHYVPRYDQWFDKVFTKEWGEKNGTDVIVDHMAATEVPARGAAEAAAGQGHDLFHFISPPAAYERQVIDHADIVREAEKRHGKTIPLAQRSTLNPKTGKYFAFSDSYVPDPGNYRIDLWSAVGFPKGPDTWDDLRTGGRRIKEKFGQPAGIGFSQEMDSNMALRALLWSFGGAEQDEAGNVTINSKQTVDALKYVKELYTQTETAEVFTWTPPSNNQAMLAGRVSFVQNAISVTRQSEREKLPIDSKIMISPALKGPVRRLAAEHVMNCYMIWEFAENKDGAQKFLIDWIDHFRDGFVAGQFYNFPCFPSTVPDLQTLIAKDDRANPPDKYKVLGNVLDWATNVGYPGYATAGIAEAFSTWVLPTMFAKVARGDESAEDAAKAAETEYKRIFARWK